MSIPSIPITDRLEGNPAALECRGRYREIVKALGEDTGRFVARFEVKLMGEGACVVLATSSLGAEVDIGLCEMAVTLITALSGMQVRPKAEPPPNEGTAGAEGEKR